MKTSKIIIASIAVIIASAVSIAAGSSKPFGEKRIQPQDIVILMLADHDGNNDGALDSVELANSIEGLYRLRKEVIRDRRDALLEEGVISEVEYSKGFVTLSFLPEDAAAIVMKDGDANQDHVLEVAELMATVGSLRMLDWGPRPLFVRRS